MIVIDDESFAVCGKHLLRWSPRGYTASQARPRGIQVDVLPPPSILKLLEAGYARYVAGGADNPKMASFGEIVLDMARRAAELAQSSKL